MNTLTEFQNFLIKQGRSLATVRGYITEPRIFFRFLESCETDPSALTSAGVCAYRQSLLESGFAAQTINRKLAAIASFGNWTVQMGLLPANLALNIKSVEMVPLAPKWLDKKQKAALVRVVQDDLRSARQKYPRLWVCLRDASIVILLLNTGLRVSEICGLRLSSDILMTERNAVLTVRAGKGSTSPCPPPTPKAAI